MHIMQTFPGMTVLTLIVHLSFPCCYISGRFSQNPHLLHHFFDIFLVWAFVATLIKIFPFQQWLLQLFLATGIPFPAVQKRVSVHGHNKTTQVYRSKAKHSLCWSRLSVQS